MRHAACTLLVLVLLACALPQTCTGYSVLTHEQIVDLLWDEQMKPLLLQRYRNASPDDLPAADGYAFGGCLIQDMGYYPVREPIVQRFGSLRPERRFCPGTAFGGDRC